jgi:hypothetical protein
VGVGVGSASGSGDTPTAAGHDAVSTITAPAVTVTAPAVTTPAKIRTVFKTPDECRQLGQHLTTALGLVNGAAKGYASLILPAYKAGLYGSDVSGIVAKENVQTAKVNRATAQIEAGTPLVATCFG